MKVLILGGTNSRNGGGLFNIMRMLGSTLQIKYNVETNFLLHEDEYSKEDREFYSPMPLHKYTIKGPSNLGFSTNVFTELTKINPDMDVFFLCK